MKRIISLMFVFILSLGSVVSVSAAGKPLEAPTLSEDEMAAIQQDKAEQAENLLTGEVLTDIIKNCDYQVSNNGVEFTYIEPMNVEYTMAAKKDDAAIYKAVSITMVPKEGELNTLISNVQNVRAGTQSNYRSDIDPSLSITGYITVYFKYQKNGGNEFVGMTSISGGYNRSDRSVGVQSQSVEVAQKGQTYENGYQLQSTTKSVSGTTWSFNISSAWYPVQTGVATTMVGAYYTFTMKRGTGNPWSHTVYCPIDVNPVG